MADLHLVSKSISNPTKHAIFLHGLGGHPFKTWGSSSKESNGLLYWLCEDINNLTVWTIEYEAAMLRWYGGAMHYTDRATNILNRLLVEEKLCRGGEIILVGHSLGGIIIKQLLLTADSMASSNSEIRSFLERIHRIGFIDTPHFGSGHANLVDRLGLFLRPSIATTCLVRNRPELRDLNYRYRDWVHLRKIDHLILMGMQPEHFLGHIVYPDSSDPGLLARPIPIDAKHSSISKPKDKNSEVYQFIKDFITKDNNNSLNTLTLEKVIQDFSKTIINDVSETKSQVIDGISSLKETVQEGFRVNKDALNKINELYQQQTLTTNIYPRDIVDKEIEKQLTIIKKARFFPEYKYVQYANILAHRIYEGDLVGGTNNVRCKALAWCSRFLANSEFKEESNQYLLIAKQLGNEQEIQIGDAFLLSVGGDVSKALAKLEKLSTPLTKTAAFIIYINHNEASNAYAWFNKSGLVFSALDSDGKFLLLKNLLFLGYWSEALKYSDEIKDEDFDNTPALLHSVAMTYLLQAIPEEFRPSILNQVPFDLINFPLASDEGSLKYRRRAFELFMQCANKVLALGCTQASNMADDYALWLELRDPKSINSGMEKLESSLRHEDHYLRRVNFAIRFGLKLNLEETEKEIEKQTTLSGGYSQDAAFARYVLAISKDNPLERVEYLNKHRTQLQKYLYKEYFSAFEIEMLAQGGFLQQARERFETLANEGLSKIDQERIKTIIDYYSNEPNSVEIQKVKYDKSGKLIDLLDLVHLFEQNKDWENYIHYSSLLFEKTHSLKDAEHLITALNKLKKHEDIVLLLKKYPEFIEQSDNIQMIWGWALYYEGLLKESTIVVEKLYKKRDHPNDRSLKVNLAIASGDWGSLSLFIEEEWNKKDHRNANELIKLAQLAHNIGSPRSKELVYHAVSKGEGDPFVLANAYFLASNAGWEENEDVSQWLSKAAKLSIDDGPLIKMSLEDLMDKKPEWDRQRSSTSKLLTEGNIYILGAAKLLNSTLINMMLLPSLSNIAEHDIRKRILIPAYSGVHKILPMNYRRVALDITAIITIGLLDLFDKINDMFDCFIIPHSTLGLLFEEKQKLKFHQPSRLKDAKELRDLLAKGYLKEFRASVLSKDELVNEVGEELALFISEAEMRISSEEKQKIVVRPSPVHRIGSLLDEEAELSSYGNCLSSCLAVVEKLKQKGLLTTIEEDRAKVYLHLQEREWLKQPIISDNADLYLDSLAVTYLQHLGLLERLHYAGFDTFISKQKIEEVNVFLGYELLTEDALDILDNIKIYLSKGIMSGKIKVSRSAYNIPGDDKQEVHYYSLLEIFEVSKEAEAIIIDDRCINRNMTVDNDSTKIPILTSLDLIKDLHLKGIITSQIMFNYYTKLRQAGYLFVPIIDNELEYQLSTSMENNTKITETAELRAIRESISSIRMSYYLQLPSEIEWLTNLFSNISKTLRKQWSSNIEETIASARSSWLLNLLDIRGWAHFYKDEASQNISQYGYGNQVFLLVINVFIIPPESIEKYWDWIERNILTVLKEEEPDIYTFVLSEVQKYIKYFVDKDISKLGL